MNCILNKDGTPIDCISDGDIVIIIESNYYFDDTYLNLLIKNNQNGKKNVNLEIRGGYSKNIIVPDNTTFSQLFKALILFYGLGFGIVNHGYQLKENDNRNMSDGEKIKIFNKFALIGGFAKIYGKEIKAKKIILKI